MDGSGEAFIADTGNTAVKEIFSEMIFVHGLKRQCSIVPAKMVPETSARAHS